MELKIKQIVITLLLLPFVIFGLWHIKDDIAYPDTVRAFGHLVVDLGVPSGQPIFTVHNMLPGDCEQRTVKVTNGGDAASHISVRSDNVVDNDSLSTVFGMEIKDENSNVLYNKTLAEFFVDSGTLDGTPLSTINSGDDMEYSFNVCFDEGAENEFQNTEVIFDLIFGEVISPFELPEECSSLEGKILFVIEGTDGKDDLEGTHFGDLILAKGGRDKVDGNNGDDCIVGGEGDDKLDGGQGNDIVVGGPGKDKMEGGSNNDILYGNDGDDKIDGESGEDIVYGGDGNDKIDGSSGDDVLYGGGGNDKMDGSSGDDLIYGEDGDDDLRGGPGDDYLNGGPGFDELDGSTGTDECDEGEDLDSCEV